MIPADLNGDGKPDLLAAVDSDVVVFLNKGDGSFVDGVRYPTNRTDPGAVTADLDDDGILDVAVSAGLLIGKGDGTFGPLQTKAFPGPSVAADMNGDGRPDLISFRRNNQTQITLQMGGGAFAAPIYVGTTSPDFGAVGDMNGDGRNDLVIAERQGNREVVDVLLATMTGEFETHVYSTPAFSAENLLLRDLDANGTLDVLFSGLNSGPVTPSVFILANPGDGTLTQATSVANNLYPLAAVGDLNSDGLPDVLLVESGNNYERMAVLWNGPPGTFHVGAWTYNKAYRNVAVADLNGDGADDLVSVTYAQSSSLIEISVALNNRCQ